MISKEIANLLETEAERINRPEFIADDPVQFPRRFERLQDIEIAAFLSAIIAWGNRRMICRDAERMFSLMDRLSSWAKAHIREKTQLLVGSSVRMCSFSNTTVMFRMRSSSTKR